MSHVAQRRVPYFRLQVADAFKRLTPGERRYAHHLNNAGWHGASVCAAQLSVESPGILRLFHTLFASNSLDQLKANSGVSQDEFDCFVEYAALVYSNLGNHLSFGDSKFIPACTPETFAKIVSSAATKKEETDALFAAVNEAIYSTHESELILGHAPGGRSAYYGGGITKAEIERVDGLLTSRRIEQWNTRVFKVGEGQYEVRIPCAEPRREVLSAEADFHVTLVFGDFAEHFARIVKEFEQALPFAQTPEQKTMIAAYIEHFKHGRIEDHKASQIAWVKDKGPAVETNIGFIETYRDPQGVRAEWEGFVAVVNKDQSKKYAELVRRGPEFIVELPWGADFEKETFANPDFTSLEVLGFASSGVPLGICIPNYDDVRTHNGFKNVTLANSASAINFDDKMNHVTDADWALYREHFLTSMSVGVGIHELLGHGTGKLFYQNEDGSYNFKHGSVVNPLTGAPVTTCYKPGETWGALFKDVANAYEECRAEAVALYLSLNRDILKIFGKETDKEAHETVHVLWLNMVRGGLVGLEFYTPEQKKWRQAHVRARFCILQTLLRCPRPLVTIDHDPANGKLDITIDSSRIATDGKAAIGELLRHLNINKAIGDVEAGRSFFERFTAVDEEFEAIRTTVLRLAKPRKQFVQPHTRLTESGDVELLEFAPNAVGAIDAFVARHRDIPL